MATGLPARGTRHLIALFASSWHPSPNFGPRRGGLRPDLIVIHYTAMASSAGALSWLCNPQAQVSAHYLIGRKGAVWQMVAESDRAWHAGAGAWNGVDDINSRSIGIEITNTGSEPFPEPQMTALEHLLAGIMRRWSIPPVNVIGHSDMAPGRKIDPGARFDWARLVHCGLAVGPGTDVEGQEQSLSDSLTDIGYPDVSPETRLAAFRHRFRPGAFGRETAEDRKLAAAVAARFEIDRKGTSA